MSDEQHNVPEPNYTDMATTEEEAIRRLRHWLLYQIEQQRLAGVVHPELHFEDGSRFWIDASGVSHYVRLGDN